MNRAQLQVLKVARYQGAGSSRERGYRSMGEAARLPRLSRLADVVKEVQLASGLDGRTELERDYSRVLHAGAFRRLQGKSQVLHVGSSDLFRTRLTHTLEVAQIARDLAKRLPIDTGTGDPTQGQVLAEIVALVHDLGHPPFGHNGEMALKQWMTRMGSSFEANAQSFRILVALETKYHTVLHETEALGTRRIGLNLTMESLAASLKYPWGQYTGSDDGHRDSTKFGYFAEDAATAKVALASVLPITPDSANRQRRHAAAEIVDWADDVAYSVHDLEDGIRAHFIPFDDLVHKDRPDEVDRVIQEATDHAARSVWPDEAVITEDELRQALSRIQDFPPARHVVEPSNHQDSQHGRMKELTTQLIDRFQAGLTRRNVDVELARTGADFGRNRDVAAEMAVLQAINWTYVIRRRDTQAAQFRERRVVTSLADTFLTDGAALLPDDRRDDYQVALEEDAKASGKVTDSRPLERFLQAERERLPHLNFESASARGEFSATNRARVVCDYLAGFTDQFAEHWYARLAGFEPQSVSDLL